MTREPTSPRSEQAVHAAAAWFRANAIQGFAYQPRGYLVAQDGAGPLWPPFYELGSK